MASGSSSLPDVDGSKDIKVNHKRLRQYLRCHITEKRAMQSKQATDNEAVTSNIESFCKKICKREASSPSSDHQAYYGREMVIEVLDTPSPPEGMWCDVCARKEVDKQPAVIYCISCSTKFCGKHQESHDDCFEYHRKIGIAEYRQQASKLEPRLCSEHKDFIYSMGCRVCLIVICNKCTSALGSCKNGSPHQLRPVDELAAEVSSKMHKLKSSIIEREDKLSQLFKITHGTISDFDNETESLLEMLHTTRDGQVKVIQYKYQKLEQELLELRRGIRLEMTRFVEDDVDAILFALSKHKRQIETTIENGHQVDIVKEYDSIVAKVKDMLKGKLPALSLQNMMALELKEPQREIEIKMVFPRDVLIDLEHGPTTSEHLTRCLSLLHAVPVSSHCTSLCHYKGITYIALGNKTVEKIDDKGQMVGTVLSLDHWVESVALYKERIYTLEHGYPLTVGVHYLTGRRANSWSHSDSQTYLNKLVIVDNQIVIPDRKNEKLVIYSLTGEVLRRLPCPELSDHWLAGCAAGNRTVVISDYSSSQLFRMDVITGDVKWTSKSVINPGGVACYKNNIFVATGGTTTRIWMLDVNTGDLLAEISDPFVRAESNVFDLYISDKMLIVPRHKEKKVLFYQLNWVM